jgi:osmoprotectant transport system permease protein
MDTFIDAIGFIFDNLSLFADKIGEHLVLSGAAIGVAMVISIPLGVWLGHIHRGSFLAINASNIGRALPSLAVISIGLGLLGVGFLNVMVAMVVLAAPLMLTNAYVAVDQVDEDAVQAAQAMGMHPVQILLRVEMPLALPLIFAGIRTAVVFVVATANIAAVAGGGGLGDIIVNQAAYGLEGVVGAAICVSLLALAADAALGLVQRLLTPPGLRSSARALEPDVTTGVTRL